jgi:hypothetical protein
MSESFVIPFKLYKELATNYNLKYEEAEREYEKLCNRVRTKNASRGFFGEFVSAREIASCTPVRANEYDCNEELIRLYGKGEPFAVEDGIKEVIIKAKRFKELNEWGKK